MRFIVYGAGAIGATLGGRLHEAGHQVVLIARGAHAEVLRTRGLQLDAHSGLVQLKLPVVEHPSELRLTSDDVVLLAMKTQDTAPALEALAAVAPPDLAIACAQNGVENERLALRRFERVQGISVMCPAVFLKPGVVQAFGTPFTGILDLGRYPSGSDGLSEQLATAFRASTFDSRVRTDILRFKYGKLLFNLGNAIEAVCGPSARKGPIADLVRDEALAAFRAAGIAFDAEAAAARGAQVVAQPIGDSARPGGSSWQSLIRVTGNVETDYLNGEVVLLGRIASVPTPANRLLQQLSNQLARERRPPGVMTADEFLVMLSTNAETQS
jgi:2-dehydropantoate 2-reductase